MIRKDVLAPMGGRMLLFNSFWNLFGLVVPMAAGLVTIPFLVRGIGVERFGLLSLVWIVIGYFSLFDLGIGRALTKLVADKIGSGEEHAIPPLAWTSLFLMLLLGVIGALVAFSFSPLLIHRVLRVPETLQAEAVRSFYILALSIPVVTLTAGLRGILEALQRFRTANLIRVPFSVLSFVGPLAVIPFSRSLVPIVAVLVLSRFVGCAVHFLACFSAFPALRRNIVFRQSLLAPALKLGGWMTVSNVVGPLMTYLDRFLIGSLLSITAVAFYTVPFDLTSRLLVIPGAISAVLFPAFAVSCIQDRGAAQGIFVRGVKYTFLAIFPAVLFIAAVAPEGLRMWLGASFAENGSGVLRWLAAGTLLNCMAFIPFALVQGTGRADITAKLHLVELPVYIAALWVLVQRHGIEGAAIAWTGRVAIDAVLLFLFAERELANQRKFLWGLGAGSGVALAVLGVECALPSLMIRLLWFLAALLATGLVAWRWLLTPREKQALNLRAPLAEGSISVSSLGGT
jgi:O-antigen/teichoic acid export membrane protein